MRRRSASLPSMTGTLAAQDWAFWAQLRTLAGQTDSLAVRASDHFGPLDVLEVRTGGDLSTGGAGEIRDLSLRGDPPDRIVGGVGEPQGPVRPGRDPHGRVDASVR